MSNGLEPVIVMIEDEEGHARLIEKNIRRAGVANEMVPFTTGLKALSYLLGPDASGRVHEGKHLLVLLDLNLPDMTGIDILARLRESEHLRRVMVIVLTTTDDPVEIIAATTLAPMSMSPSRCNTTNSSTPSNSLACFSPWLPYRRYRDGRRYA
jgi:CheY-like chemotaxis protein